MVLIVDGDSPVWVACYYGAKEEIGIEQSIKNLDLMLEEMKEKLKGEVIIGFIGNEELGSFRKTVSVDYKAGRLKPEFYTTHSSRVRQHLMEKWGFKVSVVGIEADDEVAIAAASCRKQELEFVVCGTDKDLLQIEGIHYNIDKKTVYYVDKAEADHNLCVQILAGDNTDKVSGIPGIGVAKANKILNHDEGAGLNPVHLCLETYITKFGTRLGLYEFCKNTLLVLLKEQHDKTSAIGEGS